jgi:hypothetical protein
MSVGRSGIKYERLAVALFGVLDLAHLHESVSESGFRVRGVRCQRKRSAVASFGVRELPHLQEKVREIELRVREVGLQDERALEALTRVFQSSEIAECVAKVAVCFGKIRA